DHQLVDEAGEEKRCDGRGCGVESSCGWPEYPSIGDVVESGVPSPPEVRGAAREQWVIHYRPHLHASGAPDLCQQFEDAKVQEQHDSRAGWVFGVLGPDSSGAK